MARAALTDVPGIGPAAAGDLASAGIRTVAALARARIEVITAVKGFGEARARAVKLAAESLLVDEVAEGRARGRNAARRTTPRATRVGSRGARRTVAETATTPSDAGRQALAGAAPQAGERGTAGEATVGDEALAERRAKGKAKKAKGKAKKAKGKAKGKGKGRAGHDKGKGEKMAKSKKKDDKSKKKGKKKKK